MCPSSLPWLGGKDKHHFYRTLDCRDGVHNACAECDCWCHDDEWEDDGL